MKERNRDSAVKEDREEERQPDGKREEKTKAEW